jgi:putative ABC transport system permease protein
MFYLEKAIKKWRKTLRKNEALEDGYITELESHLRDEIDRQITLGKYREEAFEVAVKCIGQIDNIGAEYFKTDTRQLSGRPPWQSRRLMPALLWNYFKIAFRKIKRQKGYSFINIAGLAIGIACCILILLWVQDELGYDRFHKNVNEIYRVIAEESLPSGEQVQYVPTPPALAPALKEDFTEIVNASRIRPGGRTLVKYGDKLFYEERVIFTEASFFELFTFPFIRGDSKTALSDPFSIVLTEEMAEKYFGEEDPMAKILRIGNQFDFQVTGVIENIPPNSHLRFDFYVPFILLTRFGQDINRWDDNSYYTYVLLQKNVPYQSVKEKISSSIKKHRPVDTHTLDLQPLTRTHLYSNFLFDIGEHGDIKYVFIFSVLASFILIIACINFMNLATARSGHRAKEIGMRKVIGANRKDIIKQYLGESILLSFIALIFAVLLIELFLPAFSSLSGKTLKLDLFSNGQVIFGLIGIAIISGILSGSYPAFFISAFRPVKALKGVLKTGGKSSSFRKILVVAQFAITIALIIGTVVVFNQLNFIKNRKLGYEKEHLLYIPLNGEILRKYEAVKNELLKNPNFINVTLSSDLPTDTVHRWGGLDWPGKNPEDSREIYFYTVDFDFVKTFRIEMKEGRDFSINFPTDKSNYIVNEKAASVMGLEKPVGQWFSLRGEKGTIIGVMKDFNFKSVRTEVEPLILRIANYYNYMFVRIRPGHTHEAISFLKRNWKSYSPNFPLEYHFLDAQFDNLYLAEHRLGTIFKYFTFLAVFIACLGLLGLAAFMAEQRTKEIGIRKVLGAKVSGIVLMLSKEFAKWVLIANIIAWPVAYFAMSNWLQNFAYRTSIGIWTFVLSAALALTIALLTVSFQAVKAATSNPVDSLRYE